MGGNKSVKQKMIQRYGKIDFLDALKIKVPECKKYKSKNQLKRMKEITYHHIKEKSKGGEATVENGALLTVEHHVWFHQQTPEMQKKLNNAFQEYKRQRDNSQKVPIVLVNEDELSFPFELNIMEISIDKENRIKAYNRSKKKRNDRKEIEEYEEDFYEER